MAQILDPLPSSDPSAVILCCYVNVTSKIQIARITNVPDWYFERVVFPGQRLLFEAPGSAHLEIHTGMMASSILSDTIPCDRLMIDAEGNQVPFPAQPAEPASVVPSSADQPKVKPTAQSEKQSESGAIPAGVASD